MLSFTLTIRLALAKVCNSIAKAPCQQPHRAKDACILCMCILCMPSWQQPLCDSGCPAQSYSVPCRGPAMAALSGRGFDSSTCRRPGCSPCVIAAAQLGPTLQGELNGGPVRQSYWFCRHRHRRKANVPCQETHAARDVVHACTEPPHSAVTCHPTLVLCSFELHSQ